MSYDKKNLDITLVEDELEKLSKNIYLESPDLWIEFSDKIGEKNFDEMIIFFACKYNHLTIVKYIVENNLLDLTSPSRNKSFTSIIDHLLATSKTNNNIEIYNYLIGLISENTENSSDISTPDNSNNSLDSSLYIPKFICPKCKSNIFESGYKVMKSMIYKYSSDKNKPVIKSEELLDSITCNKCNTVIQDLNPDLLENICIVNNCSDCGSDLTVSGIVNETKMTYDKKSKKFVSSNESYSCAKCGNKLNDSQKEYFNIK